MSLKWVKCTLLNGGEIYVNLGTAAYIRIVEQETRIVFPGSADDYIRVSETPAEVLGLPEVVAA